jgi:hypothetical protein
MMFYSDALMVGLVFFLLFGAVSLYLYMYVQQVDQKVSLLESILLDMKVSNEIKSFESPASSEHAPYVPFTDTPDAPADAPMNVSTDVLADTVVNVDATQELTPFVDHLDEVEDVSQVEPTFTYETATLKELQAMAKAKGIPVSNVKKSQLIDALKGVEQSGFKSAGLTSFLETSASVSNDD